MSEEIRNRFWSADGLPTSLFRAFDDPRYARDLVEKGLLRIKRPESYKDAEDKVRRDESEGQGRLVVDGRRHVFMPPERLYVSCWSDPPKEDRDQVLSKFGDHLVRITDPEQFGLGLVRAAIKHPGGRQTKHVHHYKVDYTKDERVANSPEDDEVIRLSVAQKPPHFAEEYEHRFVVFWPIKARLDPHFDLTLPDPHKYLTLVSDAQQIESRPIATKSAPSSF